MSELSRAELDRVEPLGSNELIGGGAAVVNSLRKGQLAQ